MVPFTPEQQEKAVEALNILVSDGIPEDQAMETVYAVTLMWERGDTPRDPVQYARHLVELRKVG
jgi:uncharacterized protein YoaH (UPF0181 family)